MIGRGERDSLGEVQYSTEHYYVTADSTGHASSGAILPHAYEIRRSVLEVIVNRKGSHIMII